MSAAVCTRFSFAEADRAEERHEKTSGSGRIIVRLVTICRMKN
jgi:hypothetical protein